jgi:hypothetical protein
MRFNKTLIAAGVGLLAFAGVAISQSVSVPQVSLLNATDLFQVIPFGRPTSGNVYATPSLITSQYGYQKYGSGATGLYTFAANQGYIVLHNGTTIAALSIVLAAAPSDGARECIFSSDTVTAITISANTGQSINNAATALTANVGVCYIYSLSNLTWDRS